MFDEFRLTDCSRFVKLVFTKSFISLKHSRIKSIYVFSWLSGVRKFCSLHKLFSTLCLLLAK